VDSAKSYTKTSCVEKIPERRPVAAVCVYIGGQLNCLPVEADNTDPVGCPSTTDDINE